jgi:predicted DNA-binding transcriptional regulator AlpA
MAIIDPAQQNSKPFEPFFDEIRKIMREEISQAIAQIAAVPPEDRFLTADEAAPLLGYTKFWLYHHWKEFPFAKKIGRKGLRFSYQGLQKYIAGRRP